MKNGAVKSASYYHAFGKHDDRLGGIATDKHRANTKVEDDDGLLNEGRRFRSLEYAIFLTPDPLEYQDGLNFYLYCGQNPWGRFDPLGLKLHMLYYTKGNPDGGDESFEAAAKTRKESIESSKNFDKEKDKVLMHSIKKMDDIKKLTKDAVDEYSDEYGKTTEVSIWSHAGAEHGPRGSRYVSEEDRAGDSSEAAQMHMDAWASIDFNWETGAKMAMYGCNTGNDGKSKNGSFAKRLSEQDNMKNVYVWGQPTSTVPSQNSDSRKTTVLRAAFNIFGIGNTYYVASPSGNGNKSLYKNATAYPMNIYRNGEKLGFSYQEN